MIDNNTDLPLKCELCIIDEKENSWDDVPIDQLIELLCCKTFTVTNDNLKRQIVKQG